MECIWVFITFYTTSKLLFAKSSAHGTVIYLPAHHPFCSNVAGHSQSKPRKPSCWLFAHTAWPQPRPHDFRGLCLSSSCSLLIFFKHQAITCSFETQQIHLPGWFLTHEETEAFDSSQSDTTDQKGTEPTTQSDLKAKPTVLCAEGPNRTKNSGTRNALLSLPA